MRAIQNQIEFCFEMVCIYTHEQIQFILTVYNNFGWRNRVENEFEEEEIAPARHILDKANTFRKPSGYDFFFFLINCMRVSFYLPNFMFSLIIDRKIVFPKIVSIEIWFLVLSID